MKNSPNKRVCLYFQVHQPYRLAECSFFKKRGEVDHFAGPEKYRNRDIFEKVARKCYIPATKLFLELVKKYPEFRVSYSISGVFLEQCEEYQELGKEILDLFRKLAETGQVEFFAETYFHSLSFLYSKEEFAEQIKLHMKKIKQLFGYTPKVFRNTEFIYNNEIGEFIRQMGFKGMLVEGWDHFLRGQNPHEILGAYPVPIHPEDTKIAQTFSLSKKSEKVLPLLLKNYKLSDDLAFRFSDRNWSEYPLNAPKFATWIDQIYGETINLFMDYETIGEHQWEDTGIFEIFRHLPEELLKRNIGFHTPSEAIKHLPIRGTYDVPHYLSWADTERNLSAWLENDIQKSALEALSECEKLFHPHKKSRKKEVQKLLHDFRKMQTSDHLYYMSTKYWNDGDVHKYFSAFESPYEAYIHFMNTLRMMKEQFVEITLSAKRKVQNTK
ncbi:polysaccharide deacetylase family protein [Candidatus Peregrinibacteria bacterium]|nr:polysaccharide deacetylase family protein [Candidatus Peregrinibacteria bacterium]